MKPTPKNEDKKSFAEIFWRIDAIAYRLTGNTVTQLRYHKDEGGRLGVVVDKNTDFVLSDEVKSIIEKAYNTTDDYGINDALEVANVGEEIPINISLVNRQKTPLTDEQKSWAWKQCEVVEPETMKGSLSGRY